MISWSTWLALAGLGAVHGLNPANGWMFATACGTAARDATAVRRALLPITLGHVAAVAVAVAVASLGLLPDRALVQGGAGAALVAVAAACGLWRLRARPQACIQTRFPARRGYAAITLWSFLMTSAQGMGLMLVPALLPLCLSDTPAREITASGSVLLAMAGLGVHLAAMLLTTAAAAALAYGCLAAVHSVRGAVLLRHGWTLALVVTGCALMLAR
jgi:hypothetical protein